MSEQSESLDARLVREYESGKNYGIQVGLGMAYEYLMDRAGLFFRSGSNDAAHTMRTAAKMLEDRQEVRRWSERQKP